MDLRTEERLATLWTYFGGCLLLTAGFSLQLYLCIQGFYSFYRMPKVARRGRRFYIYAMIVTLLGSTMVFVADTMSKGGLLVGGIAGDFISPAPVWSILMYFFGVGVIHVTGDGLLAWRCYILWRDTNRFVGLIPIVPYISSIGMGITHLAAAAQLDPSRPASSALYRRVQSAFLFLSVGVNVCATALIILRLRQSDRELRAAERRLGGSKSDTPYNKVAIMLVESALPFSLFGIAAAIASTLFAVNDSLEMGSAHAISIIWPLWVNSCAIAPQLIIFRVATGASWISRPQGYPPPLDRPVSTQLSQFMGPSNFIRPIEISKTSLSIAEFGVPSSGHSSTDMTRHGY